jgi:hypothetical protein
MPKSYRIRTTPGTEKTINIQLEQDFEFLEILSLKINQGDIYNRMCSDYGVIIGRVLVNNGYGVPNARVSVFIPIDDIDIDNPIISELYPYRTLSDVNEDGYRYNLLPKEPSYTGHAATGTFPNKEEILTDQSYVEVYDKYYRFSVRTNDSGDYMIFGVPTGTQTILMDVDLSDIGCFSLSPQDLIDSGVAVESQVNGSKFKTSTNLSELPQIVTLNKIIEVAPLWGEPEICLLGISRADFDLTSSANITIKPNAVFMGSLISTTDDDAVRATTCRPKNDTGNLCELIAGPGQILTIRQTINVDDDGRPILEKHELDEDGKVIDTDGAFLINVPMNLNYIVTNEFGEQVLSNDPKKGIPTKGKYRFKFKWQNEQGLQNSFLRGNFLVPNIKEHGWVTSSVDPLINYPTTPYQFTLLNGILTTTVTLSNTSTGGLVLDNKINVESFTVLLNGIPYFGDLESITITTIPTTITINVVPVNPGTLTQFNYTFYQQPTFDALRSYAFSLDWNDYGDNTTVVGQQMIQEAIDCEDKFYEFNYNKVYTTSMFLDRYKKGAGRAKHLGIKEIDDRTCKSTVNTFPVNDIIRNFDVIFFIFNLLINIISLFALPILFVAHFIAWSWPVLKYLLIVLGIYLGYQAVQQGIDAVNSILEGTTGFAVPGGPVINAGVILRIAAQLLAALFKLALSLAFIAFTAVYLVKITNFPRIGLPMMSYPECTSCDCDCGNAELDDDIDENSVNASIEEQQNGLDDSNIQYAQSTSFIAPVNLSSSYNVIHPNLNNFPGEDSDDNDKGYFFADGSGALIKQYKSLINRVVTQDISGDVVVQSILDFRRLFSGYDILSSTTDLNAFNKFHAPQPFLFAAEMRTSNPDDRWFGYPTTETYPQKLNEFNTRDKYFNGENIIRTTVNPQLSVAPYNLGQQPEFSDQIVVVLANAGTAQQLGIGELVTFQDPNFNNGLTIPRNINLTGATDNDFGNNAVTGTTNLSAAPNTTSNVVPFPAIINYANPTNGLPATPVTINILQTGDTITQTSKLDYLKYPTDMEYFQVITGVTVSQFINMSISTNNNLFPKKYLRHQIKYVISDPLSVSSFSTQSTPISPPSLVYGNTYNNEPNIAPIDANNFDCLDSLANGLNYEVIMFVRGVDPHTEKQNIKYDLSRIFGYTAWNQVTVTGDYYLNQPIKPISNSVQSAPLTHNTATNTFNNLYFPSFTFNITPSNYTGFTSTLPYYYLSTDDNFATSYVPVAGFPTKGSLDATLQTLVGNSNFTLPRQQTDYIGGGPFIASSFNIPYNTGGVFVGTVSSENDYGYPINSNQFFGLYSTAYFKYPALVGVNFNNSGRIVMRSDRLPTSTCNEDAPGNFTAYALHQNNKFCYYKTDGVGSQQTNSFSSIYEIAGNLDQFSGNTGLTQTLTCDGLISLECYSGTGTNVGVIPANQCSVPENRVTKGCYCLLNKNYLVEFGADARLFMEWKTRFTLVFATCRGVFAQTFQNNWINGTLYMPSFNKRSIYPPNNLTNISTPKYEYCRDIVVYNNVSNNFFYRSSPWSDIVQEFIGKEIPQPPNWITLNFNPGYNEKNIMFPTTILDMGPRDSYISEICNNPNFKGYMSDQFRSTSYNENGDIIQLGFLSRILNENFRQAMIPITTGGSNSEGKGLAQFFNSDRGGDRIDGDFAQALSINSEFKINPFIDENYGNADIFIGDDGQSPSPSKPVFGVFYRSSNIEYSYRRKLTPGIEIYNISPLLQDAYGHPKTQVVPHYKWILQPSGVIFGAESNNWWTNPNQSGGVGFFKKGYQNLDYTADPYFDTPSLIPGNALPLLPQGFITNFIPDPQNPNNVITSPTIPGSSVAVNGNLYLVGAPSHFYFGLNNGKTAMNRFIKKYIDTADI